MSPSKYAPLITLIPSILQFVEDIHGPKTGSRKFASAVSLAQAAALTSAMSGAIPLGTANDVLFLTNLVQTTFDAWNQGKAAESTVELPAPSTEVVPVDKPKVVSPSGVDLTKVLGKR